MNSRDALVKWLVEARFTVYLSTLRDWDAIIARDGRFVRNAYIDGDTIRLGPGFGSGGYVDFVFDPSGDLASVDVEGKP